MLNYAKGEEYSLGSQNWKRVVHCLAKWCLACSDICGWDASRRLT